MTLSGCILGLVMGNHNGRNYGKNETRFVADEPPPFLGRWSRVYAAVLCYLALLITALYVFTRIFHY